MTEERIVVDKNFTTTAVARVAKSHKYVAAIYEVFPLICPCDNAMKIIAFITNPCTAQRILNHLKMCSNPFDALPYEPEACEYPTSDPERYPALFISVLTDYLLKRFFYLLNTSSK